MSFKGVVYMWNTPKNDELKRLPPLYANEDVEPDDVLIHMHMFLGASDWFHAEYSPQERIFYGYAILNQDLLNSEWGDTSFDELLELKVPLKLNGIPIGYAEVERESGWKPKKFAEVFEEYKRKHGIED